MADYVFAVPGEACIIDTVKADGRTTINNETLAEVQQRYPTAVLMPWETWRAEQAAKQDTPIKWEPCSVRKFYEMLEVLPPIDWNPASGFLVGEPTDHSFSTGQPRYQAYRLHGEGGPFERYFVSSRPLTREEWRKVR